MAPREVYRCAKLWKRAGAGVQIFGVWPLGPQPAERGFFGHNKGVACGAREPVTNPCARPHIRSLRYREVRADIPALLGHKTAVWYAWEHRERRGRGGGHKEEVPLLKRFVAEKIRC